MNFWVSIEKLGTHEARRIAGAVAALHIVPAEVLEEEARHNVLVEEVGDHILAGLQSSSVMRFGLNH